MKVLIITNMYPDKKDKAKGIFVKNLIDLLQKDIKIDYSIIPGSFIKNFFKGLKNTKRKIKEFNPDIIQGEYLVTGGLIAALLKNFAKTGCSHINPLLPNRNPISKEPAIIATHTAVCSFGSFLGIKKVCKINKTIPTISELTIIKNKLLCVNA